MRRLPAAEVLRLFEPLCAAVDYAHGQDMIHRDIKSANVLLTARGEPVLSDYGIARIIGMTQLTATGTVMGSAHYMSPEQGPGPRCGRAERPLLAALERAGLGDRFPTRLRDPRPLKMSYSPISFPRGLRDPRRVKMSYFPIRKERVMEIDWRKAITSDPEVLLGKPVVKGTRLSVEFVLGLFAEGWTEGQVLEEYPNLTDEDLRAIFAFATECMREESLYPLDSKAI